MKNNIYAVGALILAFILSSCAPKSIPMEPSFTPFDYSSVIETGEYQKSIDNFLVVFDASDSMKMKYNDEKKFRLAKRLANNMNQTIPALDIEAGILLFGPSPYSLWSGNVDLLYGMTKYSQSGFADSLAQVTDTGGGTPMALAINAATEKLMNSKGDIAVILISDAEDVGSASAEAAAVMKSKYQERVCIYTILVGDGPGSRETMESISQAGGCGFGTDYDQLSTASGMADFVRRVFLKKGIVKAKPAPAPVKIAQPLDSDGDGVYDTKDRCPETPMGIKVDSLGCPLPIKKTTIELRVEFDFDKYFIRPEYKQKLKEFADFLKDYPQLSVLLEGHTDNMGSEKYNQVLSEQRAQSVKNYLVTYFRVDGKRLSTMGSNYAKPETTNKTDSGRQRNRRVYVTLTAK